MGGSLRALARREDFVVSGFLSRRTLAAGFAREDARRRDVLTDHDDRVRLAGVLVALGLVVAIAAILLRLALLISPSGSANRDQAPAAANHAAGASLREARP